MRYFQTVLMMTMFVGIFSSAELRADKEYRDLVPGFKYFSLEPTPLTEPPPPGAIRESLINFGYNTGGGCEDHYTEVVVTDVKLLQNSENSKTVEATLEFYDRTKSGRRDMCRGILNMDAKFSDSEIRQAVTKFVVDNKLFEGFENTESLKINIIFGRPKLTLWF